MEKRLKILILTNHFYPENFKCNDMAFELQDRGYDVSVMTPIPDYPKGKFYDGYGIIKKRFEKVNGVKVHRSLLVPRGNGKGFRLSLNYLTNTIFSTLKGIYFAFFKEYDVVLVHETSPIFVGIPATIIKKIQKIPMHTWILDLWPESLTAASNIDNKFIYNSVLKVTNWIYKNSNKILIGSKGFEKSICEKGDYKNKIHYFPNWVENVFKLRADKDVPELPKGFNVMVAGNIGDAQDLPHVLDAFLKLKDTNINFIIVGDGRKREFVQEFIKENDLENVYLLGSFPPDKMSSLFAKADVLFMALTNREIFSLTVPSRIQAYMASGKPIVAMINGEGANLLQEADCGWSVPAENSDELTKLLLKLSKENPEMLRQKGDNGKKFSDEHFDFDKSIDILENIIHQDFKV